MVKEFMTVNNTAQIRRLLKVLGQDFALSQNPNSRKGGLIGLAAIAIALGRVRIPAFLWLIHTARDRDRDGYNRKQWLPVPVPV